MTDRERKTFEKYLRAILGELNGRKARDLGFDKLSASDLLALALKCSEALRPGKKIKIKAALIEPESKKTLYGLSGLARIEDRAAADPEKGA